ncbi:MFS transporter [Orrella marina]|uniref:MFS transporter n=1 Tax=Orrella marina TaxID=2163011 RepID=A0A2R4XLJ7_9BURK|nr:MFS transporter [Orrella marina]AWB34644.1 MFS transporter [Orrella marina]
MTTHTANPQQTSRIILLLALAAFSSTSAFRVLDPALPQLAQEYSVSTGEAADVVKVFALAYGVLQFFYGPMGDRFGKFRTLAWATLACALGNVLVALAGNFDVLLLGRIMSGATAAAIVPLSMAWIGDHVPYDQRQATLAQFMTGTILGMTSGLVLGGLFTDTLGWRASFWFLALVYTVIGLLLLSQLSKVPESVSTNNNRLQVIGPIMQVLKTPWARVILVVVLLEGALVFGVMSFVPSYLQLRHGVSSTMAGLITSLFGLGSLIYVARARWLVAKLGEARMVWIGGWAMGSGYLLYTLGFHWSIGVVASIACGFSYYLVHAVLQTNATQMVPEFRATAVSLFASFLFSGQAIGVALGALIVDHIGIIWVIASGAMMMPFLGMYMGWRLKQRPAQSG